VAPERSCHSGTQLFLADGRYQLQLAASRDRRAGLVRDGHAEGSSIRRSDASAAIGAPKTEWKPFIFTGTIDGAVRKLRRDPAPRC